MTPYRKYLLFFCLLINLPRCLAADSLFKKIDEYARGIKGNLGVYAMILETGESASYNGGNYFPMQSVYKFPISMAVLKKIDEGTLHLQQKVHIERSEYIPKDGHSPIRDEYPRGADLTIREILRYNVSESDGSACDVLIRLLGGVQKANDLVHQFGVRDVTIATTEMIQVTYDTVHYQNRTTPRAMTELLRTFYTGNKLSPGSRKLLLHDMTETTTGLKRLKGLLPGGTIVAHKTGTAWTNKGLTRATNDVGIISLPNGKHLAISVFISDCYNSTEERELTIAKVSKAAFDHWAAK